MELMKLLEFFKFEPSDKQLLENYLKPKIQGTLCWNFIQEKELYGPDANPWEIFNDSSTQWITSGTQKIVYVFAHLTKISDKESSGEGNEIHYARRAGCGTWHVETGRKSVMDGDNIIGEKRMLVFEINDINGLTDGVKQYCYCNMHEYFLKCYEDYVVCRITFDTKKPARVNTTKAVSGTRGSTIRSKANKKMATTCTTKDERQKALLIENSPGFRDSEKEAPNHDSWSLKDMEKFLGLDNNVPVQVQEQQQQQQQQEHPMGNVSCMLGKRKSSEAQEAGPSKKSRI